MSSKRKGKMIGAMEALANAVAASTSHIVKENNEKARKLAAAHNETVFHSAALPASASPEEFLSSMLGFIFGEDFQANNTKKRKRPSAHTTAAASRRLLEKEQGEVVVGLVSSSKRKASRRSSARHQVVDTVDSATADPIRKPGRRGKPPRTPQPARDEPVVEPSSNPRRNPGRRARTQVVAEPKSSRGRRGKPAPSVRSGRSTPAVSPAVRKGRKDNKKDPSPSPVIRKGRRRNNKPTLKSTIEKKAAPEPTAEEPETDGEDLDENQSPAVEVITIPDTPEPRVKHKKAKSSKADDGEEIEKADEKLGQEEDEAMENSDRDDASEKDEEEDSDEGGKEKTGVPASQKPKRLFNPTVLAAPKPRTVQTAVAASTAGPVRRAAKTPGVKKPLRKPSLPAHVEPSKTPEINLPKLQPDEAPPAREPTEKNTSEITSRDDEASENKARKEGGDEGKECDGIVAAEDQVELREDPLMLDNVEKVELNDVEQVALDDVEVDEMDNIEDLQHQADDDDAVEDDGTAAEGSRRKKKFTLEPLFPKSIFAANSPARPVEKKAKHKSISFAIPTESKKRKTDESDGDLGARKRMKSSIGAEDGSKDGVIPTGKSTLRERIENMRKRASQKSVGTPYLSSETGEKHSQDTPNTKSSGFFSAKSRAQSTTSLDTEETPGTTTTETGDFDGFPSTRALSFSMKTPVQALEKRFDMASPDAAKDGDVEMSVADSTKKTTNVPVMNNLLTSVSSFLPTNSNIFGYPTADPTPKKAESAEEKAARIAKAQKIDAERREAEMLARREGARLARQAEAKAKQRKVLEHKRKMEEDRKQKEIEQKRKEDDRLKRLRDDLEARKKKKLEDERKREMRQQRAKEHREKIAAAEEARRLEMERKANANRQIPYKTGGASSSKAGASTWGGIGGSSSTRPGGVYGTPSILKKTKSASTSAPAPGPVTSYEMSAERKNTGGGDSDSDSDGERHAAKKGKQIPEWASKTNVLRALETQTEDPDKTFSRVQSVNLEDVFASTQQSKIRYRSRNSSGAWTKDRLTAKEEMEYKKKSGFI